MHYLHQASAIKLIRVAGLLASLLLSAGARAGCEYTELAAMQISYPGNQNLPAIAGEINGTPVSMAFDTGSYRTFLLRSEIERQHVKMSQGRETVGGIGGSAVLYLAKPDEVAVGPARVKHGTFAVIDALGWSGFGGLVGSDFLSQADLELELSDNRVRFLRFSDCGDHSLAYWSAEAQQVGMRYGPNSNVPLVEVQVNGENIMAAIDTGATITVLDQKAAERMGVTLGEPGAVKIGRTNGIGDGSKNLWRATFDSFAIGDESVAHPILAIVERGTGSAGRQYEMVLGRDFLTAHRVLLAHSQRRVYFSYLGGRIFAAPDSLIAHSDKE